jgi:hypothetical protein
MRISGSQRGKVLTGVALLAVAVFALLAPAAAQSQVITICKQTVPAGGAGFPFVWQNGTGGPLSPFTLNDGECQSFNVAGMDAFNRFTENVPAGWTLTSIACNNTTTPVWFDGNGSSDPAFQPGDNRVNMDLNQPQVTCVFTNTARPADDPMDVYAVKFVCGSFLPNGIDEADWPVKPGNYLTAINVHNPNRTPIFYRKKAVLLYRADKPPAPEEPQPPGELYPVELGPDWGVEVDCNEIRRKLIRGGVPSPIFIKGFVVFEVPGNPPLPLDVTAVYTSHGWELVDGKPVWKGFAEDVESVLPKRVN